MDLRRLYKVIRRFIRSLPNRQWFRFFTLWLAPFLLLESFFFATLAKESNQLEFYPGELVLPSLMHAGTALLVAFVAYKVKSPARLGAKLLVTVVLGSLFVDYEARLQGAVSTLRIFSPPLFSRESDLLFLSLTLILLFIVGSLWLGRGTERMQQKHTSLTSKNVATGFFIFVGVLAGGSILGVLSALPAISAQSRTTPHAVPSKEKPAATDKPDIYYLVVDRYASQELLGKEFSYDNSGFTNFLQQRGFVVRNNATANYPFTDLSVASTLNADYLKQYSEKFAGSKIQSHALYHNLVRESSVIRTLKDNGYLYVHIGTWYNATSKSPHADVRYVKEWHIKVLGAEKTLTSLEGQELAKSPYLQLLKNPLFKGIASLQETNGSALPREQIERLYDITEATDQHTPRFVFAHLLTTHPPYYFNADGSHAAWPAPDNEGKNVREKYTDQITYANSELERLIETIQARSNNNAVILLTSDEGPHPLEMNPGAPPITELTAWSDDWLRMKYGVLQAAYIPKATQQDFEHLSSVNLFRIVLNRYLGYRLEYLPQCNIALPKGRDFQFVQADVSRRVSGVEPDPFCDSVVSGAQ